MAGGPQPDPTLLELFQAELDTHIPVLSDGLLALERGPTSDADVAAMMRAAHSIKGAARIVGVAPAVRIAHVMEDCFLAAKEGRTTLTGAAVDILLHGVDALQRICSPQPNAELNEAALETLHEQIAAVRDGRPSAVAPPPAAAPPQVIEPPAAPAGPAPDTLRVALPPDFDDAAAERLRTQLCHGRGPAQQMVCLDFSRVERVSAAALALLTALAGDSELAPPLTLQTAGLRAPVDSLLQVAGLDRRRGEFT